MSLINNLSSYAATVARLGRGLVPVTTRDQHKQPKQMLELYDFEACPYCRKVREVLCELDLDYLERPVAHGSGRRSELRQLGGKVQAPFLVDPNTKTQMYESDDIIRYLNETYGGERRAGWSWPLPSVLDNLDSMSASIVRFGRGGRCRVDGAAEREPLTLYNMEGSPYCRKVRETLCELDLVHIVRNVPKGSPQREELKRRGGKVQVPYLIDPNSGREMYESDAIVAYLESEYGPQPEVVEAKPLAR